jgi:hypothetical protein
MGDIMADILIEKDKEIDELRDCLKRALIAAWDNDLDEVVLILEEQA